MNYLKYEINVNEENPFNVVIGKKNDGSNYCLNFKDGTNVLVAGSAGSGKTVLLNSIMISLMNNNSSNMLKFILVDYKMVEFSHMIGNDYLYCPVINTYNKALQMLDEVCLIMEKRYEEFIKMNVLDLKSYNKISNDKLPYIYVIFDELDLYGYKKFEFIDKLSMIIKRCRVSGIHFILATQDPSSLDPILSNINTRVCFRMPSRQDARIIFDEYRTLDLESRGWAYVRDSHGEVDKIITYYVNDNEFEKYLK